MCGRRRYPSRYPCGKGLCSPAGCHRSPPEAVAAGSGARAAPRGWEQKAERGGEGEYWTFSVAGM